MVFENVSKEMFENGKKKSVRLFNKNFGEHQFVFLKTKLDFLFSLSLYKFHLTWLFNVIKNKVLEENIGNM